MPCACGCGAATAADRWAWFATFAPIPAGYHNAGCDALAAARDAQCEDAAYRASLALASASYGSGPSWFASLVFTSASFHADEWCVTHPEYGQCWVGSDGEARPGPFCLGDPRAVTPPATGWLFGDRVDKPLDQARFVLEPPPATDPVRLRSHYRETLSDDGESTCDDCGNNSDDCECVECSNRRCSTRGTADDIGYCSECDQCENCCDCVECRYRNCDRRGSAESIGLCDTCNRCDSHCECSYCEGCDNRIPPSGGYCTDCDRCGDCCEGHSDGEHPEFVDRKPRFHAASRAAFKRNPSRRYLAVEIEVASTRGEGFDAIERTARKWGASICSDGSLPDDGFEIPTAPANGDVFATEITELCEALRACGAKVDSHCGLHVHVDARDFRHYDMRRLVLLYAKLEDALFDTQPDSRAEGSYTKRCGKAYVDGLAEAKAPKASKHALMANVYKRPKGKDVTTDLRDVRADKYADARYQALNLHSWVFRGTVECRLHTGSVEPRKIIPWGILLAALLDYALAARESEIARLRFANLQEQQAFLHDVIAPTDEVRAYLRERWRRFGTAYAPAMSDDAMHTEVA